MNPRLAAFVTVGAIGFLLQIGTLTVLTWLSAWPYEPATALAVEVAVLHNFWWHERWTWSDRRVARHDVFGRLAKYHVTTGLTSIGGNLVLTAAIMQVFGVHVVAANVAAVAAMAGANFLVADRWVFARQAAFPLGVLLACSPSAVTAAELTPETIGAWNRYVAQAESRLHTRTCGRDEPEGATVEVTGGAIHHWRGSVFVPNTTVDRVVHSLTHPGTPPPQEDVLESRVLERSGDSLRVYLKLARHVIVTVVYDTEHRVTFARRSPSLATSHSVATRIAEVGGADRGFLWRLNSYWRYAQEGDGVRIDVESLSLSRGVPRVARPVAAPIISRVARESMVRTLEAVRRFLEGRTR
jgi:putative flippase GtrA